MNPPSRNVYGSSCFKISLAWAVRQQQPQPTSQGNCKKTCTKTMQLLGEQMAPHVRDVFLSLCFEVLVTNMAVQ